jgi:hypothetical protein
MSILAAVLAASLASAWAPTPAYERDWAAVNACFERVANDVANKPILAKFIPPFEALPPNNSVPSEGDVSAINQIAVQARPCIEMSRALAQSHLPQLVPAHTAMEARVEIVRALLSARRITYANAAFLIDQATGEFSSRTAALTQPLPDFEHQIENDRNLLAALHAEKQTADTADPGLRCHWQRALILCRPPRTKANSPSSAWLIYPRQTQSPVVEIWWQSEGRFFWRLVSHDNILLAEMPQPEIARDQIVSSSCDVDGVRREDVLAIVKYRETERWWTEVTAAWVADPKARAFTPLVGAKIACENESYGE